MESKISLWDSFSENHWLREYGWTQVIVIDDIWHNEQDFILTSKERKELEKALNIKFHFFSPSKSVKWDNEWFSAELEKAKNKCPNPSVILLDLMFGKEEKTPLEGSGKRFLNILSNDKYFKEIPVLIITAGEESEKLLGLLKAEGGSLQAFLNKNSITKDSLKLTFLEWALLSDPNINAFSIKMREAAQKMRKAVLDNTLKEAIQYNRYEVPRSVLFVGESGSGKNYLSNYLHKISDRKNYSPQYLNFTDISSSSVEAALFGAGPSSNSPARYHLDPRTGEIRDRGALNLSVIGAVTNAHNSTLILDELGNSPAEIQTKLIRFLDDRQILPLFWSEYVPSNGFYNVWVIMTMQPQHREKLRDLERRLAKMTQIDVPLLSERKEDIIPLSVIAIDNSMTKRPQDLFTSDAIEWLNTHGHNLTVSILTTTVIPNLKSISSKAPYNATELNRALEMVNRKEAVKSIKAGVEAEAKNQSRLSESIASENKLFKEKQLENLLTEQCRIIVNYILQALELNRDKSNDEPNYPQTWMAMTGDTKKRNSSEYQRFIGNYIFQLSDEEIISLMKQSKVFAKAVIQCGKKVQSAKKRLNNLEKAVSIENKDKQTNPSVRS